LELEKTAKGIDTPVNLDSDTSEQGDNLDADKIYLDDLQKSALRSLDKTEKHRVESESDNYSEFYEKLNMNERNVNISFDMPDKNTER
jgi:hypothetical protein